MTAITPLPYVLRDSPARGPVARHLGFAAALLLIGAATLVPQPGAPRADVAVFCLRCGSLGGPDLALNVVLFVPLGIALAAFGVRPVRALAIGAGISLAIELAQSLIPGRFPTLRDVLCNGTGAWLGVLVAERIAAWIAPSRATRVRLAVATGLAILLIRLTGAAFEFAPSVPPYFGHWSPDQEHLEHWTGRVTEARLDGLPVPDWQLADPAALEAAFADGFTLEITGVGGARTRELGGIVTISDGRKDELLLVGPVGDDLVVRTRRRAADLRFGGPEVRFAGLMRGATAGAPFTLRVVTSPARTCATLDREERCLDRAAFGSAWILLFTDRDVTPTARILLHTVTIVLLVFPVGLLLGGVPRSQAITAVLALLGGMLGAAWTGGLALPTAVEGSGAAAGLVAGVLLSRLVNRSVSRAVPPSGAAGH